MFFKFLCFATRHTANNKNCGSDIRPSHSIFSENCRKMLQRRFYCSRLRFSLYERPLPYFLSVQGWVWSWTFLWNSISQHPSISILKQHVINISTAVFWLIFAWNGEQNLDAVKLLFLVCLCRPSWLSVSFPLCAPILSASHSFPSWPPLIRITFQTCLWCVPHRVPNHMAATNGALFSVNIACLWL